MPKRDMHIFIIAISLASGGFFLAEESLYAGALIDLSAGGGRVNADNIALEASSSQSGSVVPAAGTSSAAAGANTFGEEDVTLSITRSEIGKMEESSAPSMLRVEPEAVRTTEDLRSYALAAIKSDKSLESMSFSRSKVEVRYKLDGRLLALVPVTFIVRASALASGGIKLDYPWYSFLTIDNGNRIETEMRVAVDNALRRKSVGSVRAAGEPQRAEWTPAEAAEAASQVYSVLKSSSLRARESQAAER